MSGRIIIGVDHGYAAMKTAHCAFPAGLVAYEHEPYTSRDVLEYDGKFFVVGSGRQPLQKDKTAGENYYLLTLAAIAKELEFRKTDRSVEVILAAGLPLTSFGRDKVGFKRYLLRDGRPVSFRYEGRPYEVTVSDVVLLPQGYSAVMTQTDLLDEPSVIVADIGGWTVDLMQLDHGIPNAATCRSLELGVIQCLNEIGEQVRRSLGLTPSAAQIESVLRSEANSVDERIKAIAHQEAERYVRRVLSAIAENGMDARATPILFLGGGAGLMKRHFSPTSGLCQPVLLDDVTLNAKGYERIVGQMLDGETDG